MSKTLPPLDDENNRARLLTFITTYQGMLKINPKAAHTSIARMVQVDASTGARLIKLGIVKENEDGTREWVSKATPEEIADMVVLDRRPAAAPPSASDESVASLKRQLAELNERFERLSLPAASPKLADDDAELLRIAVNDYAGVAARVGAVETIIGDLLRRVAGGAAIAPAPARPKRDLVVGIIGVWPRDLGHIGAKGVTIRHIEHSGVGATALPSGLDAVIVTEDGSKKWTAALSAYPRSAYRVTGGIKSINTQLQVLASQAI